MTDRELLPCPFCGAKHVRPHEKRAGNHTSADKHYSIRCGVCTFNGPRGLTAEQAVDAWNRRAEPAEDVVPVPRGEWLPIESAPKDKSAILIFGGHFYWEGGLGEEWAELNFVEKAYWNGREMYFDDGGDGKFWYRPTHWQPLPQPPLDAAQQKGWP